MGSRILTAAACLAAGMASVALPAAAADKITFGTNWTAQAEHGGFYYAKAYGIYDAYGLDVDIKPGGPQVNTPALLVGGQIDFAMLSGSFNPINMVRENIPYVAVAASFQKDPQILMAHADQGFKTLADLKGKPIFISAGAHDTFWQFLHVKFDFADEQIRPYTHSIAPFLVDKSAIQQGYITNEPFRSQEAGVEPKVFLLADYGYSSYATLIGTSQKLVDENPDLVQRFVDASIKGWYGYLNSERSKADALIIADNPDYSVAKADEAVKAMNEYQIAAGGDAATLGIGAMTDARWKDFFDTMVKAGVYPPDLDYKKGYTLQFVDKKVGMSSQSN